MRRIENAFKNADEVSICSNSLSLINPEKMVCKVTSIFWTSEKAILFSFLVLFVKTDLEKRYT